MTTWPEQETTRPAPSRRRSRVVAAAAVLLVAAAGSLYLVLANTDEAQIGRVVGDFATAADRQDYPAMLELLCAEEASGITEDDDYDPTAEPIDAADVPERAVTDIQVAPDAQTATALMTTPGREPRTIRLRHERDHWKVCAPAAS
jgi:hypothetical protein